MRHWLVSDDIFWIGCEVGLKPDPNGKMVWVVFGGQSYTNSLSESCGDG